VQPGDQSDLAAAGNFIDQGEIDFKAGKYQAAARDWQHALVDDSKNGAVILLLAQALFATGQYDEAAGATQAAMQALPEDKWGVVVTNYSQLYGNVQDYTDQLKSLEKARDAKPDSPALHFLLGVHFGYLGYPKHAVKELDKALTLVPKDLGSRKMRDIFAAKWPEAPPLPAAAVEAAKELEKNGGKPPELQQPGAPGNGAPGANPPDTSDAKPPGTPS
ncbi:MAG TPA: tetratricopeptide repeat protein, partial [Pirellulales bacterium]|nr:tetratricopeptide repeat protein [Pirellulales bacterium]